MRLEENPQLPQNPDTPYAQNLNFVLSRLLRNIAAKVNAIGDGKLAGGDLVATAVPTTGTYATGDFVKNSAPSELGTAGSKYFIDGWKCVAGGSPGTFVQARCLTGN
jgi:hypothetical protein